MKILVFVDVETAARLTLFDPEVFPLGDFLVEAERQADDPDAPVDLALGVDVEGGFLTGAQLEDLLGICLGAQYMLDVNAFALAN